MELNNRPGFSRSYPQGSGEALYRRSIYTFWKRTVPSPMLKTFDAPEREFCTARRSRTNTPLQALLVMNGPQFVEAARKLGEKMMREGGATLDERVVFGFRLVTARRPTRDELAVLRSVFRENEKRYRESPRKAVKLLTVGETPYDPALDRAELAAFGEVARLMLNLSEAITKG